jgi:hypothetical protein
LAVIVGLAITLWSWLVRGDKPSDGAPVSPAASEVAQPGSTRRDIAGGGTLGISGGAIGGSGASEQPAEPRIDVASTEAAVEAADSRAARLVQSFPCEGSLPASRVAICTHWSLATSDYNLSLQYKSALRRSKKPQALRQAHSAWLARLDDLKGDLSRLRKAFDDWRDELSRI